MKKSITTLDLNLLLCLQLLMQERSVTKAAKRMNHGSLAAANRGVAEYELSE
ncbi:HTH-type transcriptional regulator yidZ [Shigella boydii 5216-82]|nr:HTH-type transcriptional regulator yidZ [Shigella boydii 5216-82]